MPEVQKVKLLSSQKKRAKKKKKSEGGGGLLMPCRHYLKFLVIHRFVWLSMVDRHFCAVYPTSVPSQKGLL